MSRGFWIRHAALPGMLFLAVAWAGASTPLDVALARAWAFDAASGRFIGTGTGEWWARHLVHGGGGILVRVMGLCLVAFWLATARVAALSPWRRATAYALASIAAGLALVGLLKGTTNVDCPRALDLFGGGRPYVHLFDDRPDALPRAHCFPGGHSASGFAMFAVYFALRERSRRAAQAALLLALAVGTLFAWGQQARGAHFFSHDAWSAALMWFTALGIYSGSYGGRIWKTAGAG